MHRTNVHYVRRPYDKPTFVEYDSKVPSNKQDHYVNRNTIGDYVLNSGELTNDIQEKIGIPYDYHNDYNARYLNVKNLQFEDVHRQMYIDPNDYIRYKKIRNNLTAYRPSSRSALPVNQEVTELYNKNNSTGRLEIMNPRQSRIPQMQKHLPGKLRPVTAHTNQIMYPPEDIDIENKRRHYEYYPDSLNRQIIDSRKHPRKYHLLYIGQNEINNGQENDYDQELEFDNNENIKYDLLNADNEMSSQHAKIDKATSPRLNQTQAAFHTVNNDADKKPDDNLSKTSKTTYVLRRSHSAVDMSTNNTEECLNSSLMFNNNEPYKYMPVELTQSSENEKFEDYGEFTTDVYNENKNEPDNNKSQISLYNIAETDRLVNTVPADITALKSQFDDIVSQCVRVCDTVDAKLKKVESSSQKPIEKVVSKEKNLTIPKPNKSSYLTPKISTSVKKKQDKCKKANNVNNLTSTKKRSFSKLTKTKDESVEDWTITDKELFKKLDKGEIDSDYLQKLMDDMINHKDKNSVKNDKILKNIEVFSTNSVNKSLTKNKKGDNEPKTKINNREKSKEELKVSQIQSKSFSTDKKNNDFKTSTNRSTVVLEMDKTLDENNEIPKSKQLSDDDRFSCEPNCSELQTNISENNEIKPMNNDFANLELKRCKSYIINLIDRALSKELGTTPENKSKQQESNIEITQLNDINEKNISHKSEMSPRYSTGVILSNPLKDSELYTVTQTLSEATRVTKKKILKIIQDYSLIHN